MADISPFNRAHELEHKRESECRVGLPYDSQPLVPVWSCIASPSPPTQSGRGWLRETILHSHVGGHGAYDCKEFRYNEPPFWVKKTFDAWTENLKQLFWHGAYDCKEFRYNEPPFWVKKTFDAWTENLKQLFQTVFKIFCPFKAWPSGDETKFLKNKTRNL